MPTRPRPVWARVVLTVLMASVLWGGLLVGQHQLPADIWSGGVWFIGGPEVAFTLLLAAHAGLATKVSYRWFDAFLLLVPFYCFVWSLKILYRVAALPCRDWQPRPSELRNPEPEMAIK